jgi:NADPH:quinone reductase-like Zn-dependent oxidoreductase
MRALVKTSDPPHLELGEAPDPRPHSNEALVEVKAFSLNRGEVRRLPRTADGTVVGWDVAGIVREPAADGSGPRAGARVVGLVNPGAWAELAAVKTSWLAELPEQTTFAQAATLPVAGMTALETLALGGQLLGRRVLITGAAGGVGRFAIQLARDAGAHVTGVVGSPERGAGLKELGADEVVTDFTGEDRFDFVLESAGGEQLAQALNIVKPRGIVVAIGHSSGDDTTFSITDFYRSAAGASLRAFMLFDELLYTQSGTQSLTTLAQLIADGKLDPQIDREAGWRDYASAVQDLLDRKIAGKAVLHVD